MKVVHNIVTKGLSGRIMELVFRQLYGNTVVSAAPRPSSIPSTPAQRQTRINFKRASVWAKSILADTANKLTYQRKAKPGQTAYNVAVADFFNVPRIGEINLHNYHTHPGSHILAFVTDDFKVVSVKVKIETSAGQLIEEGFAAPMQDGLQWRYDVTAPLAAAAGNVVSIIAMDLPGNVVCKQA